MGSNLALAVEEHALASLGSPRGNLVSNLGGLLLLQVGGQGLRIDGIGTEPEQLLLVQEVPTFSVRAKFDFLKHRPNTY